MDYKAEIGKIKKFYGEKLSILAHYYQQDDIVEMADITGDSYKLAVEASMSRARYIVFCGVLFMAESAGILARKDQCVFLPDFSAGCPLADMITPEEFTLVFNELSKNPSGSPVPLVYINSSAGVKSLAGKNGGIACTSSNAQKLVRETLKQGKRVFFLPDKNLGVNTGWSLGLNENDMYVLGKGGDVCSVPDTAKMIIWDGYCNVHVRFTLMDVRKARHRYPYAKIYVHPECSREVVENADFSGSTREIIEKVRNTKAGEVVFIGTEYNLVHRLSVLHSSLTVLPLRKSGCINMNKINPQKLLAALNTLETPCSPYKISVQANDRKYAKYALEAMIHLSRRIMNV